MLTQTTGTSKKKIITKLGALMLSAALCFAMPFSASAAQVTKSIYTGTNYTQNSRFDNSVITNAIDISEHNGEIDFAKLKKTDTKITIVRVGCRGYGSKGTLMKDKNFDDNIKKCLEKGFETGVYFYSQALTEAEAKEEANFVLKYIKGYKFELPVYYDYEFAGVSSGRLDSAWRNGRINKEQMTKNAIAFCNTIEEEGYRAGIYASKSFYEDNLIYSRLEDYAIWVAHYASKTNYAGQYQAWQYSAKGKVSGIDGYVDSNFIYYDVLTPLLSKGFDIEDIKKQEYTGEAISPVFSVFYKGKELVKGEDYYVSLEDNTKIGTAKVTVTGINKYESFTKSVKTFTIVPPKVEGLKLEERGTNSLKVSWDKCSCASKYYIQVHRKEGWVKAGTTKETSFEITDLATASNYPIRVRAYKKVDDVNYFGFYSDEIETATSPAKPTELKSTSTPSSIKLSWKKQSNASYYEVYLYNKETQKYELFETVKGGKNNSLNVTELLANKRYAFKVRAFKKSKDGELLKSKKSDKYVAYTSVASPEIISAQSNAQKRITVKWNKSSGASGYQVMWSTTKDFSSNYKTVKVTKTSTTLTTAQSNRTYYVKVRAYKTRSESTTYSPWSSKLSVKTK